jgi:hypothetical protein
MGRIRGFPRLLGVYTGVEPPGFKVDEMGVDIVSKLVSYS